MTNLKINTVQFNTLNSIVKVGFILEEGVAENRVYKTNLPFNFPEDVEVEKFVWWSYKNIEQFKIRLKVDLSKSKKFAKHYFNRLIYDHFADQNFLTTQNFIGDTEVWLQDENNRTRNYKSYKHYTIRVVLNKISENPSILITYDGKSYISTKSVKENNIEDNLLTKVVYNNRVAKFKNLTEGQQQDKKNIFPKLNRDIRKKLNINIEPYKVKNKYKQYYKEITSFYEKYLKGIPIADTIKVYTSGFDNIAKTGEVSEDSNLLEFGNSNTHFMPFYGLKEHGPLRLPENKNIKFIFIFHKSDDDIANKLFTYFNKGYKSFPGLESLIGIPISKETIDVKNSIKFSNDDNPIPEIEAGLYNSNFDTTYQYAALYISRIKKDDSEEFRDRVYFKLKESLLKYEVVSQVIYRDNIENQYFNYFLPNIAIAILAKLQGIPWRLYRPIKKDLIIGIGAFKPFEQEGTYIGSAFCFKNDGEFYEFDAFKQKDTTRLAESIKKSIKAYIKKNKTAERLIIHFYKDISGEEEEPIKEILKKLNLDIPYIIVTIFDTESKDYVIFDTEFDGIMPQSGTFVKINWNEFLLSNNTRYSKYTGTKIDSFPFPIKVKIKSSDNEKFNDFSIIRELIDQVYQFSRMYWKSIKQRNKPVTIEYSKMVADLFSHFEGEELPDFAKQRLWFL
jgi:hypothetical protein